jgi:hypothetical protein
MEEHGWTWTWGEGRGPMMALGLGLEPLRIHFMSDQEVLETRGERNEVSITFSGMLLLSAVGTEYA